MERVFVRGVDGSEAELALVSQDGETVFVCPLDRFDEVEAGDERSVVGFPREDVRLIEPQEAR